ncbi:hypothetical protein MNEG_11433 [Monoraphidium neglectum]|uniref:Prolyl 4-hydroxylase alpha subunit domain-containing protein n=1 Tax=Monoraphidium neglectum TaxID=145388 RepID=A0A0D2M5K9_9CHLO|nr:hypothetical protein MNEG_11433 [Monoraphidium neglectum]KIY96531.1 hypothetical protein MNEG_11433 [Monoraphidium neglectum]|eukprot:XP_013895551.1 hypothetical protein MNEG_11433 [Monoraphidium neglectum]
MQLRRSTVLGEGGKSVEDGYRTSYGTFLKRGTDPILAAVDARVADWVRIPVVNGEDMQILRYDVDQYYKRLAGFARETAPWANDPRPGRAVLITGRPHVGRLAQPASENLGGGVPLGLRGDALLFWSIKPDAHTLDVSSMHTGCPVIKGVKWTATKWIHAKAFRPADYAKAQGASEKLQDPGKCEDDHESCEAWAAVGECSRNAAYM